ncbi:carboxylesterase [Alteribacillus persepolensis]|uniref:Carboxylesterase n=1 Tax=Alteribacillus persepolensis TaxID=568899 RepID=A0A1G8AYS6_9BACI|nr:alpha/beta fold hydrolase [Alteribacillus persepolensis]SDH26159.1 carboxylesterase [Alteribacillus persepolensis]
MDERYLVMKGAEPFYFEGDNTGVLVIHGFSSTTASVYPIGQRFHQAGFTVFGPRLKGHGTHPNDLEQSTYEEWCATVEEGYAFLQESCDSIYIAGLSMGGTLALHLANQYPSTKGIILINAALDIPMLQSDREERFIPGIHSDIKKEGVAELAYDNIPVQSLKELEKLMKETKEKLSHIHVPARIFVSREDHVVPMNNSEFIYKEIPTDDKHLIVMEDSYHVATLDHDQGKIALESIAFINGLTVSTEG